jgi:hypothetical protein
MPRVDHTAVVILVIGSVAHVSVADVGRPGRAFDVRSSGEESQDARSVSRPAGRRIIAATAAEGRATSHAPAAHHNSVAAARTIRSHQGPGSVHPGGRPGLAHPDIERAALCEEPLVHPSEHPQRRGVRRCGHHLGTAPHVHRHRLR